MNRAEILTTLIANGENRNAAEFINEIREENPCCEYASALVKILLVDAAKRLNDSVAGFYCDTQKLAEKLFSVSPPPVGKVIDDMCRAIRDAAHENHKRTFEKALYYIKQNICDNQLSIGNAAEYAGVSQSGLVKLFTEYAGMTPGSLLGKIRVERSLELLDEGISVRQAGAKVGFSSCEAYIRTFKKHMQITPGEWKRNKLSL